MPAPTTADELLDLVVKSNLVEEPRLRAYLKKLGEASGVPGEPAKIAQYLVRDALLTYFQAEQLLQGKYKRFNLGKYKVLERLGSGGMGTVFLCEHKLMRRRVAVKVLPVPKAEDRASLDRFYREARAVAAVDHPNIVRAYDIDQDDNLHFLVMEWVDGTNLQDLVKKFGPLDPVRACHYIYGAAVGLQHAHEIGLVHRDIKPGNILIDRSGVVKILDLGLARLTHDQDDNLTRQNDENVLGTADYLAPEQAMDSHTVDIRADIYSLGATFYFLLTGSAPFPEGSVAQKLIWHQNRQPRSIKVLRAEVPDAMVAVVERMMAKDPEKRYRSPAEVMAALSAWVATPIPPPSDREMPTLSPVVAGLASSGARGPQPSPSMVGASLAGGGLRTVQSLGSTSLSGMPTAIVSGTTPAPAATPAPPAPANAPGVWTTLDTDTQSVAKGDTDRPPPKPEDLPPPDKKEDERPSRVGKKAKKAKMMLVAAAVGSVVLLAGTIAGVWLIVAKFAGKTEPTQAATTPTPSAHRITVTKAGGEHTAPTLREALTRVGPGDTIVIAEPRIAEASLKLERRRHKDLVIESGTPDGKPAVIEFTGIKGGVMLEATDVEGLRIRNVEFDGNRSADVGIRIDNIMPGATFEGVTVRNVLKSGFHLWRVTGTADRPIVLDRVRVVLLPQTEAGVLSQAVVTPGNVLENKFIIVRNSRFEGPGGSGVRVDGPAVDLDISHNRFFSLNAAASFVRPTGKVSKGNFSNNTTYRTNAGLQFETSVNDGQYQFSVTQNYFAMTPVLLRANGAVPGLTSANNLHDPASGTQPGMPPPPDMMPPKFGTPTLNSTKLDAPKLPNPNPEDDATFLRFPPNTGPTVGPKLPVGAR
jgi:serine/threonine protein kinase